MTVNCFALFHCSRKKLFIIYGKWTECLWGIDPVSYESYKKHERRSEHPRKAKMVSACSSLPWSGWGLRWVSPPEVWVQVWGQRWD